MLVKLTSAIISACLLTAAVRIDVAADKPQVIKLQRFRKALWTVHVTMNGVSGDFLLDTGGGNTLVTEGFSSHLTCTFWGRTTGYNMFGQKGNGPHCDDVRLAAGEVNLTPVNVGKIDFGDRFAGDKAPDGLLSLDAFDGKAITLDQVAGTLTIETDESLARRTKGMRELPLRLVRGVSARELDAFVGVNTSRGRVWLELDSGAGGVSLVDRGYADVFHLDPAIREQQLRFDIARDISVNSPVLIADMIMDGNLGQPFMSQYVLTFDLRHSRLWARKAVAK